MEKVKLRKSLLQQRQSLSVEDWQKKSLQICQNLSTSTLYQQAKTVLAYFSFRQEPDLSLLFTDSSRRWGFSRCVGQSLYWHSWTPNEPVNTGAYGITEPLAQSPTIIPDEVDLILVPCVACDHHGYRLGYGGGYYDRLLSSPEWATKLTIGIVFEFAYFPQLPIEPWDRPLQGVCTEVGINL